MNNCGRSFGVILVLYGVLCWAADARAQTPNEPVEKVATDLIQIDVTVTDAKGKVVTGLVAEDFDIYENGVKQKVSYLTFVSRISGGADVVDGKGVPATAAGVPTRSGPGMTPSQLRRTIAVVVDDLNLSFLSVKNARDALKKFVNEQMQPGDLVAIVRTGGGMGALQQFTSDKQILLAAIDKIRWSPVSGSTEALASVGQNDAEVSERFTRESSLVATGASKQVTIIGPRDYESKKQSANAKVTKIVAGQERDMYNQTSLGTVRFVLSGMRSIPGRKSMMLFSDGLAIDNDSTKSRASDIQNYLRVVADNANRASVVVYTFDTKGMRSMSIGAADSTYEIIDGHRGQKENERYREFKDSQDGLAFLAEQTGGKAVLNTDDLNGGIQRALDEQTGYYLLSYLPDSEGDAKKRQYSKIEIKVRRPGLKVSYRSRFFRNDTNEGSSKETNVERQLAEALASPFVHNGIALNMSALYAEDPADGSYIRSFLHIDARNLAFTDAKDGWKTAVFNVAALIFGHDGAAVENKDSKYTIRVKGSTYESMLEKGFVYVLTMKVKKAGLYQYRAAVRDAGTGEIGSASQVVSVPDVTGKQLALSSIAVEAVSPVIWQQIVHAKAGQQKPPSTLLYDTVLRKFEAGSMLRYGYEIYNPQLDPSSLPRIGARVTILRSDGTPVEDKTTTIDAHGQRDPERLQVSGAVPLNAGLASGNYVLRVAVTDNVAGKMTIESFPFEIVGK